MRGKMKDRLTDFFQEEAKVPLGGLMARSRASELIRTAEKFIGEHRYDIAAEQLTAAQRLDPSNPYIPAILARAQQLRDGKLANPGGPDRSRYLQVTVGSEFASGIRAGEPATGSLERWVASADAYLKRGALDNAFEALMNAYMLDPVNPAVMACEERVLPAWEKARAQGKSSFASLAPITARETQAVLSAAGAQAPSGLPPSMLDQLRDDARIELLRQQKEAERLRHEQARWRDASRWR